jgi:hypothetical protein
MKMKKTILLFVATVLFSGVAAGQCQTNQTKPEWVDGKMLWIGKSSAIFARFYADGNTLSEARRNVENEVKIARSNSTGLRTKIIVDNASVQVSGNDDLTVKSDYTDEYNETCPNGTARVWRLYQVIAPSANFKNVVYEDEYSVGLRPLIPSWAQFYKGHNAWGTIILLSEAALLGGGAVMMITANSAYDRSNRAIDLNIKNEEYSNYENAQQVATILFVGAGVVYAANVLTGWLVPPSRKRFRMTALPAAAFNRNGILQAGMTMGFNITF